MRFKFCVPLMLTALPLGMVACTSSVPPVENHASYGPGYPEGSASWTDKERGAYKAAFEAAKRDQREGYRYDDDRGAMVLDVELHDFSRRGYRAGYYYDAAVRRQARADAAADLETPPTQPSPQ